MPRDGEGIYSVPPGTEATTLQTISSTDYNAYLADITADLNLARPISAGGTGATNVTAARTALGVAASGANTDLTSITTDHLGLRTKCSGGSNTLAFACGETLTGTRYISFLPNDVNRTVTMHGSLAFGGTFIIGCTLAGAYPGYPVTMRANGATDLILPLTGTLATLTGTETLTNKTLTAPIMTAVTVNSGGMAITGATSVSGPLTASTTFDAVGNATVGGTLGVTGAATLSSTLGVTGASTFTGAATFGRITATSTLHTGNFTTSGAVGGTTDSCLLCTRSGSDGNAIIFVRAASTVGSIGVTATTTSYNTSSDARLKTNVQDFDPAPIIDALAPKTFEFIAEPGDVHHGFLAQDLHTVFPEAVTPGTGEPGEEGFQPWSVDLKTLVPVLVAEIQSLRARVAALEA